MPKVAAVVVLYNPEIDVFDNISTYLNQVGKLYIVDNSEVINNLLFEKLNKNNNVEYICNYFNLGIAAALNIGAKRAIDEGYEYLLTMDQDSKGSEGMVNKQIEIIQSSANIGIVATGHFNPEFHIESKEKVTKEILYTMTNGNLLSLAAYKKVGGFLEELFIDHVDHEYCLRLNANGLKVIMTNEAVVYHKLGTAVKIKFLNFNFYPTYHSPLRLYYRTRNRFYVERLYKNNFPDYVIENRRHFLRELLDIILCEKDLWRKFKMIVRGYLDYRENILGKFQNDNRK
jgi:rhamnosyltransferase